MRPAPTATTQDTATIPTYYVGADQVILLGDGSALVSSKSEPGAWREVDANLGICLCPGFQMRGKCRHVSAVRVAEEQDRASAQPVPDPLAELAVALAAECQARNPDLTPIEARAMGKCLARRQLGVMS